jgi:hypothetical protein
MNQNTELLPVLIAETRVYGGAKYVIMLRSGAYETTTDARGSEEAIIFDSINAARVYIGKKWQDIVNPDEIWASRCF